MLNTRVRDLEAALDQTQPTRVEMKPQVSTKDNNDYRREEAEECKDISEAIGSLSLGADGQAKYHGESAGSEVCGPWIQLGHKVTKE